MRTALFAALTLFATPAFAAMAEDWARITSTDTGAVIYVDNGSLHREGNLIVGVERWDHRQDSEAKHREVRILAAYDCRGNTYQIKAADVWDADNTAPKHFDWTPEESTPQPVDPASIAGTILKHVCSRKV
ncbi:hypothetical protein OF829_15975 [Sphingomonas sp. LB-2]|uniref:surface-adhesin E family protein n=1 Tax=Sphingomonas caeni TaxID=2984949 RepID=UPI0022313868|nr:surface-adhesin E family protein [Sphingomonas caeni]MCW3848735.1 hypothetical protein [Sphingomonas caeni]